MMETLPSTLNIAAGIGKILIIFSCRSESDEISWSNITIVIAVAFGGFEQKKEDLCIKV
jgi:hypothetical protein